MGLPVVATSDAHYLTREDAPAHDVLLCINTGKTLDDPNRMKFETRGVLRPQPRRDVRRDAGPRRGPGHLGADRRAGRLLAASTSASATSPPSSPPTSKTPEDYLGELCERACTKRYGDHPPQAALERLEHELGIINRMGFATYFLIVWDFVRFARETGIPSSARGSACGALVSYLLTSATSDPLKYDLLFERFLDPTAPRRPTSTSTSARTGATRSSSTSGASTARPTWPRSARSARWPPRPRSRTWAVR